jgi:glycosyltransferase involved in cell wall biosynthesis
MTPTEFPRILVVTSNNFNLVTGGGITLTNLFRGWPTDRVANLHEDSTPEDRSVCQNFYRLSEEEIQWAWPFSLAQSWYKRLSSPAVRDPSDLDGMGAPSAGGEGAMWVRLARRAFGDGVPRAVTISGRLRQWLERFRPQLLYGFLGSMAQVHLMGELARTCQIPLTIHIMDDWPAVLYRRGLLGPVFRRVVQREFLGIVRGASLCMGICEDMCKEYKRRYGFPFLPFHNALDLDQWIPHAKRDWKAGSPFVVRYVGSIVADGQREALRDVCHAVTNLRSSGKPIEMWVHAPAPQVAFLGQPDLTSNGFHLAAPPPPEAVVHLLSGADLLVLPFNFDKHSLQYIRLSMPTKVPAYMASGTPVLVYGPAGIATARYAERDGWGHVLSTPGVAPLQQTLLWLVDDQATRERLGRRAHLLACERHDAAKVRPAFQMALARAATGRGVPRIA